ncbi:MlaC/ttg2D family ABC transporter substrate-binding protein [Candidimonas nitroreducens]|uniref:ABC transporter n=1 Tax=Candidimonas nitroreducens TaxID=683354 RepID=A0A225M171_9BURK|nr:ABC transporter substrate-binding protein [Candidimonas nitroreducens]OWT53940.1 ABC transporter [Candidimonas nitroreducens]
MFFVETQSLPIAALRRVLAAGLLLGFGLFASAARADTPVDPNSAPNEFVQTVGNNALEAIKHSAKARQGDLAEINRLVDKYVLPYVDLAKTTRLAAGRYWRQATPQQQQQLVQAFKGTLIRTYSGALNKVTDQTSLSLAPFRGDPKADDVVVHSQLSRGNAPAVGVDYRLEKTPQGWKIYDLNVEGIWLIQNYRNQFAEQISQNGIDGLIKALNERNR